MGIKDILKAPIKFLFFISGLILFLGLHIIRPIIKIKVGSLIYSRIGHLAANTEFYLRRRVARERKNKLLYKEKHIFFSADPANYQLLKMIQRKTTVINSRLLLWMYKRVRSYVGDSKIWIDFPKKMDNFFYEFNNIPVQLQFTPEEEEEGKALLERIGVKEGASFVCFHVRDSAYLEKMHSYYSKEKWSYHDYRDCSINNYLAAAEYLASLGIFVIRMGYIVSDKLSTNNPLIIDYATKYRSDFGDIYLSAKCKFFLASEGGLSSIPWIFNVPVAYSNGAPVCGIAGWRKEDIFITKKLWSSKEKRFLSFPEVIKLKAHTWYDSRQYKQAGLEIIENTSEEILDLVREMNSRLDRTWKEQEQGQEHENESLQRQYRALFDHQHRRHNFPSRVGTEFLRKNYNLLGTLSSKVI